MGRTIFNRVAHKLTDLIADIFQQLGLIFRHLNISSSYFIDSFPVAVCKNIRIVETKIIRDKVVQGMAIGLSAGNDLYGDVAYLNQEQKALLSDLEGTILSQSLKRTR